MLAAILLALGQEGSLADLARHALPIALVRVEQVHVLAQEQPLGSGARRRSLEPWPANVVRLADATVERRILGSPGRKHLRFTLRTPGGIWPVGAQGEADVAPTTPARVATAPSGWSITLEADGPALDDDGRAALPGAARLPRARRRAAGPAAAGLPASAARPRAQILRRPSGPGASARRSRSAR